MVIRTLVAVALIPVIFLVVYVLPPIASPIALSIICALSVYEALCATNFLRHNRVAAYSIFLAALTPFWVYTGSKGVYALGGLFLYVFLLFCESIASKNTLGLERMGGAFFLTLFIPLVLTAFLRIKIQFWIRWQFYILFPFVAAFMSDACAYFTGMAIGKHKLAPSLSPKKTVEGAVGGFVGATLGMMVYGLIWQQLFGGEMNYPVLALYGALGSIASQVGDLSFSCIKREYGIKDFGHILPGHGGILDRFDSIILCAPLMELLLYIVRPA
ncbi:MAG: phosphatidate cytidylyltransferase [Oscillospiraceae bacterium]|nr:phosphatidate cytidylyltransferase [Oscillospiraceae bacterium]